MNILKYKKLSGGRYKVYLDDNSDIVLYESIIVKYNLLIKKQINMDELNEIKKDNDSYMVYDIALRYINTKMRCEKEIIKYLEKKDINRKLIDDTIRKLRNQGYLDDRSYIKCFIADKIHLNNYGPSKIKKELLLLDLDKTIIDEELDSYPLDKISENLEKLIDKKIKLNKNYGETLLREKIISEFINKGYDKSEIIRIIDTKTISTDDLYEKEYNKLYNKYSKKYPKEKLEYIIRQKLYQKGFKKGND